MTVKMTSTKSRCVVFLMTLSMVYCVPLDFTTSRYKEEKIELNDNISLPLLISRNPHDVPQIFDLGPNFFNKNLSVNNEERQSKSPKNYYFQIEDMTRNLNDNNNFFGTSTPSLFPSNDVDSRKFDKKKTPESFTNFQTINFSKTRTKQDIKNAPKNTKSKSSNSSLYTNFVTKPSRDKQTLKPGVFQIKIPKPTTPKPFKFLNITRKPIIINLTKVPSNFSSFFTIMQPIRKTTPKPIKTTRTPGWISKIKSTTPEPTASTKTGSFGWPNNQIKNKNDWNRYKNYTDLNVPKKPHTTTRKKPNSSQISNKIKRPTKPVRVKYVPKPGHKPTMEEIKQNWYESGVPYPNPMPEIITNSFASPSVEQAPTGEDSVPTDSAENTFTNALSTFNLDMRPAVTNLKDTVESSASGCPTVHISSSVLSPQQRQGCSDLNLVINSHFHQNVASDRTPTIDTYQAGNPEEDIPIEAVEEPVEEAVEISAEEAETGVGQADPGGALADPAGIPQADSAGGGSPGSGGSGGPGASGGNGGNGGDGNSGLGWPDIKGMLDAIDWLGNKFGGIFNFLKNPYLYIIPATLFFLVGFFLILALFPWWVPLLFLLVGIKAKHKPNVVHHKHVHKAVHHPDGWFWNQHTKTWENVQDYLHKRRVDNANLNHIPQAIQQFGKKYGIDNPRLQAIKRTR